MHHFYDLLFEEIALIALLVIVYVLFKLSQRLGEALQMKPLYHFYTLGGILIGISFLVDLYLIFNMTNILDDKRLQLELIGNIMLSIGVTLCLFSAIKYWGWLIKEILQ
ncbi:MAG: hypothetical protein M8349_04970 [ANME-2 cluster archaeon]|nr:hypothetical protein [ANME-2 cluster archaeon]